MTCRLGCYDDEDDDLFTVHEIYTLMMRFPLNSTLALIKHLQQDDTDKHKYSRTQSQEIQ